MHIFQFAFYSIAIFYIFYHQFWLIYWFLAIISVYYLISLLYPRAKTLSTRRKFTLATWSQPSEGIIYNNIKLRVDNILKYFNTFPADKRPTITHFIIRACGQVLRQSPDLNGKLIFGRFIPYQTCDVSCFVNVDGANDVGLILIKDVPNKSLEQIGDQVRGRAKNLKPKGGDQNHKKRMGLLNILPSSLIAILYKICVFLTSYLGVNIPAIGLQKDAFGAMIVTSVGMFGYKDAYTSFFGTVGQWILLTVNAAHEQVIACDGKVEIATIVNVNCSIDHRYLHSGARGQKLVEIFHQVFQNPEKYISKYQGLKKE